MDKHPGFFAGNLVDFLTYILQRIWHKCRLYIIPTRHKTGLIPFVYCFMSATIQKSYLTVSYLKCHEVLDDEIQLKYHDHDQEENHNQVFWIRICT